MNKEWDQHFHTSLRPVDSGGATLKPLDLVIIGDIPEQYWCDPGFESLRDYEGKFGLVTYHMKQPWYYGKKGVPGWVSPTGDWVNVETRKIDSNSVVCFDFILPPSSLTRIPYNSIIMSIFADYPWRMMDDEGPSDHAFVIRGMQPFAFIERVLNTPYEDLERAHQAAVQFLAPEV